MCFTTSSTYKCSHPITQSWTPPDVHQCPEAMHSRLLNSDGTVQRCGGGAGNYVNVFIYRGLCDACWSVEWLVGHGWGCCQCSEEMEEGV
ncbi:hypothetical protein PgNI_11461 [Pyricularia grisea]|uniref:Uncharacterized protein n=1 Tax=Pyricularia grisea TaxID=148305 RepID=A0A6P8APR5_PYRGI|nr:hypothetical protein PgNI_11461 [Pyricularia grisea]TLD04025.1 hypothetical protein PgNI_11461 [Pyricularia grisea]